MGSSPATSGGGSAANRRPSHKIPLRVVKLEGDRVLIKCSYNRHCIIHCFAFPTHLQIFCAPSVLYSRQVHSLHHVAKTACSLGQDPCGAGIRVQDLSGHQNTFPSRRPQLQRAHTSCREGILFWRRTSQGGRRRREEGRGKGRGPGTEGAGSQEEGDDRAHRTCYSWRRQRESSMLKE